QLPAANLDIAHRPHDAAASIGHGELWDGVEIAVDHQETAFAGRLELGQLRWWDEENSGMDLPGDVIAQAGWEVRPGCFGRGCSSLAGSSKRSPSSYFAK